MPTETRSRHDELIHQLSWLRINFATDFCHGRTKPQRICTEDRDRYFQRIKLALAVVAAEDAYEGTQIRNALTALSHLVDRLTDKGKLTVRAALTRAGCNAELARFDEAVDTAHVLQLNANVAISDQTWTTQRLAGELKCSEKTVSRYAGEAGVTRPKPGGGDHAYTSAACEKILQHMRDHGRSKATRDRAAKLLKMSYEKGH